MVVFRTLFVRTFVHILKHKTPSSAWKPHIICFHPSPKYMPKCCNCSANARRSHPTSPGPGCITPLWITNGPFLSEFEAKRWFRLESKVTVHLHNSALHQRAMSPIPYDWPWLNTGNGYPPPAPTRSLPRRSKASPAMSAPAPAAISFFSLVIKHRSHLERRDARSRCRCPRVASHDTVSFDSNYQMNCVLRRPRRRPRGSQRAMAEGG